jgi:RNA polymerase sigma-70 factor, ECF subfamily
MGILTNARKTGTGDTESRTTPPTGCALGAPLEGQATSFAAWWRASAPFALPRTALLSDRVASEPTRVMNEESFCIFYERTARSLKGYLTRLLNDSSRADDILQEAYLRLLQAKLPDHMNEQHRKNYLFRVATNLVRSEAVRPRTLPLDHVPADGLRSHHDPTDHTDLETMLRRLNPRQHELLLLAYVERFSHEEIAAIVGAKTASIRPMLARARGKLADMLKRGGFKPNLSRQEKP